MRIGSKSVKREIMIIEIICTVASRREASWCLEGCEASAAVSVLLVYQVGKSRIDMYRNYELEINRLKQNGFGYTIIRTDRITHIYTDSVHHTLLPTLLLLYMLAPPLRCLH